MTKKRDPKLPDDFYFLKGYLWGLSQRLKSIIQARSPIPTIRIHVIENVIEDINRILSTWKKK